MSLNQLNIFAIFIFFLSWTKVLNWSWSLGGYCWMESGIKLWLISLCVIPILNWNILNWFNSFIGRKQFIHKLFVFINDLMSTPFNFILEMPSIINLLEFALASCWVSCWMQKWWLNLIKMPLVFDYAFKI